MTVRIDELSHTPTGDGAAPSAPGGGAPDKAVSPAMIIAQLRRDRERRERLWAD